MADATPWTVNVWVPANCSARLEMVIYRWDGPTDAWCSVSVWIPRIPNREGIIALLCDRPNDASLWAQLHDVLLDTPGYHRRAIRMCQHALAALRGERTW